MNAEPIVLAALDSVFAPGAEKVFPNTVPADIAPPYAVYAVVGSAPENTLAQGVSIDNDRYQVDVYAKTKAEVLTLARAVRAAMLSIAWPVSVIFLSRTDVYEADVKLHRALCEFSVWFNQ
jgi:hypothetical protein